jgi:hypothetical protein
MCASAAPGFVRRISTCTMMQIHTTRMFTISGQDQTAPDTAKQTGKGEQPPEHCPCHPAPSGPNKARSLSANFLLYSPA